MKTITYNPETHVLVPKGMMYELPELPMPIKGKFSKDLFDGVQMHQYAMRYLDEAIAAAPQPEPNHNWCAGCSPDNCSGCGTFYEIKKQRDELLAALHGELLDEDQWAECEGLLLKACADTKRLNFLDGNLRMKMGWHVGAAPAGNLSVSSVIQPSGPMSIRTAIDAAMAKPHNA